MTFTDIIFVSLLVAILLVALHENHKNIHDLRQEVIELRAELQEGGAK